MVSSSFTQHTLLCLIVAGGYIAFFQIFYPQNHFIMTLPFYQNVKLGPTRKFYYQSPSHPPQVGTNYHSLKMSKAQQVLVIGLKHFTYQAKNKLHYLNTI